MKHTKSIIMVLILLNSGLKANWPLSKPIFHKNTGTIFNTDERISIYRMPDSIFTSENKVNAKFVTGNFRRRESNKFTQILDWDCKVKFRLNKNMNFLISYN